ncbi:MAG: pyruvate formate lyase family protein [Dehalococcoidia bacterium]
MTTAIPEKPRYTIKEPKNLSPRNKWLRDYYFRGLNRKWNNEFTAWTTGTTWDFQFQEGQYYIVPETYAFLSTFTGAFKQTAKKVTLHADFWKWGLPERHAWFVKEVMVHYLPHEILPGDLIAGARFNLQASTCLNEKEAKQYRKMVYGKNGARAAILWLHNHGYGNVGATSGHLIPDYTTVIEKGWESIYADIDYYYKALTDAEKKGKKGAQLRSMLTAATMAQDVALKYSQVCIDLASQEPDAARKSELLQMASMLKKVPWEPARTFWEGVQSLWLTHMLVMSDESYPGPGLSFGRIDQYLYPLWQKSINEGMDREFGKEILKCFWMHCNTVYDAMIRTGGNQGITSGFGQVVTLSGVGPDGKDMTNDLTYAMLEVIDEMTPILEPKPNVRLHRNTPDQLYDKVIDMISSSQGAPFLINFDERSIAGMMLEAKKAAVQQLVNQNNVYDYAPVGCLENTMCGNDRSGTVDINLNLLKAVELALTGGYDLIPYTDPMTGKMEPRKLWGPHTGNTEGFKTWEEFWNAYVVQTTYIVKKIAELYQRTDEIRAKFLPTPYLSCLVKGCAEKGKDINEGGAELSFTTVEAVTYGTTVDSLLAVKYLVFDKNICTVKELTDALKANWAGYEVLQAQALNKAPKYGRDDDVADEIGKKVMELWTEETWKYKSKPTGKQFRPGMLSWNYWISDGYVLPASADGRPKGKFLSNAICPSNGADINGPTANVNSVGKVIGGKNLQGKGDWLEFYNLLPNGASHTITFNPSLMRDPEHKKKFKAFLRGYVENGGTCLQINMVNADMLRDAQKNPENYKHLLVRVTGYNAYFTAIGRELQNEIIARESHQI